MGGKAALTSAVVYKDPKAALKFLEEAFGFELTLLIEDEQGNLAHSQMTWGDGMVMVGNEWTAEHRSPASIGGLMTQTVHIQLPDGAETVDAHCERARKAGAKILVEPETQFYGDRTYRCKDPEGHIWTVSQTVQVMHPDEWDTAGMGLKTTVFKE
ncbi:VOC family protein [Caulobacter mirabilis]|uniref:Glyoxalase n=1 Tax=Caulobacter mirabilis TaxID=69666 RepID=A0A2D2AX67_9CAUL|nr:VOC family protein [Caulobacter mirabilis]ATQ42583.1 glyoxalase [Caulobacter mirabilis]